ncbi:MAG: AAA family ATPase [Chloroflexota bacterium]
MDDLFKYARKQQIEDESPLANRMRPRTLDEYIGQEHIIGPGRLLRRAIQADQLSSLIFYGPPGTGKTTLAMVIANSTSSHFITINAVLAGVKDIREAIAAAEERRNLHNLRTTLFVDEVHRWNRAQQDALLPHVERGTILLIGATTENPYFTVNQALVSRSRIFQLKPLTDDDLFQVAKQALETPNRGYGHLSVNVLPEALEHLVHVANGDARSLLNALELAVETTAPDAAGQITVTLVVAEESIQRRAVLYDRDGDIHYDTVSAFIKSIRGSDPDAAMYWLAKMVYAGEDPRFIFRRLAILASEDIGMGDPQAVSVVNNCWNIFEKIGMPEGQFPLAEATLYLATAPKSNSAFAFFDALKVVQDEASGDVPNHLKDGTRDKEGFGHGKGYLYPHAYRDHWVAQQYLPSALQGRLFYQPSDQGYEQSVQIDVARRREAQLEAMLAHDLYESSADSEVLSTSPKDKRTDGWLQRVISGEGGTFGQMRDKLFELADIKRHHVVLDGHAVTGLLTWEAVRQAPEGGIWAIAPNEKAAALITQQANSLPELRRPQVVIEWQQLPNDLRFDRIVIRDRFTHGIEELNQFLDEAFTKLNEDGRLIIAQRVPKKGQRLVDLVPTLPLDLMRKVRPAEDQIYQNPNNPMVSWDSADFERVIEKTDYRVIYKLKEPLFSQRVINRDQLTSWFKSSNQSEPPTYVDFLMRENLSEDEVLEVKNAYFSHLAQKTVDWKIEVAFWVLARK